MKVFFKRTLALLCVICISISAALIVSAEQNEYSNTANSGVRDEICTSLDGTGAKGYYIGDNSYESLSTLQADKLLAELCELMTDTHKYKASYADSKNYADETDCQKGDGSIVLLYTTSVVQFSDFIGSGSIGWNREHVWPKSLGGFDNSGAGADLHHIRPDDVTTNAKRGNLKYGNVENGNDVKGSSLVSGALGGSASSAYFEPLDNVKGDVARICLYVYVRYGQELSKCSAITNVFESVEVLLEWCESDPVDTWEMGRNEVVGKIQGNRNVFIDYPEFAWLIFGKDIPEDMPTPSGMAMRAEEMTAGSTVEETASATTATADTTAAPESSAAEATSATTEESTTAHTVSADDGGCVSSTAMIAVLPILIAVAFANKKRNE